jgi:hypothetical protein
MMVSIECFESKTCRGRQVQHPLILAFLYIFDVIGPMLVGVAIFRPPSTKPCLLPFLDVLI